MSAEDEGPSIGLTAGCMEVSETFGGRSTITDLEGEWRALRPVIDNKLIDEHAEHGCAECPCYNKV